MNARTPSLAATIFLVVKSQAALTNVDWWQVSGSNLLNDSSVTVATLAIAATQGTISGAHPLAHSYNGDFWTTPTEFVDTISNNETLPAFDFLTVPDANGFTYSITLTSSNLDGGILALGNLSPLAGTTIQILPSDALAAPISPVTFLQSNSWDGGFDQWDGALDWNAGSNTLSPQNSLGNDTGIAFFLLPKTGITSLTLQISGSNALPPGDTISLAVGQAIPEPRNLFLLGATFLLLKRRK